MKYLLACYLILITYCLYADVPGNKSRPSYDVAFTGLQQYPDHVFFFQRNNVVLQLNDSSSIHVPGGFGAPQCVEIWGINKKNLVHTDTIYFCSGDERSSMKGSLQISGNHLSFIKMTTNKKDAKKNNMPVMGSISSDDNHHHTMYLVSGLSFIALLVMVFFVWKRNKRQMPEAAI